MITFSTDTLYSANSALAGMTSKYRNAFCLVAPLVMDTGVFVMSDDAHYSTRLRHFTRWGMTARGKFSDLINTKDQSTDQTCRGVRLRR